MDSSQTTPIVLHFREKVYLFDATLTYAKSQVQTIILFNGFQGFFLLMH